MLITILAQVVVLIIFLHVTLTTLPFVSWENILSKTKKTEGLYDEKLIAKIEFMKKVEDCSGVMNYISLVIGLALLAVTSYDINSYVTRFFLGVPLILSSFIIFGGVFYEVYPPLSSVFRVKRYGRFDSKLLGYLLEKTYKSKLPKDVFQLFKLYHLPYLALEETPKKESLDKATFDFSNSILRLSNYTDYNTSVFRVLLEPKNISILAAISNVLTDDKKLKFINSSEGYEILQDYKESLKEIENSMLSITKNKEQIIEEDLATELINNLAKAKENKYLVL